MIWYQCVLQRDGEPALERGLTTARTEAHELCPKQPATARSTQCAPERRKQGNTQHLTAETTAETKQHTAAQCNRIKRMKLHLDTRERSKRALCPQPQRRRWANPRRPKCNPAPAAAAHPGVTPTMPHVPHRGALPCRTLRRRRAPSIQAPLVTRPLSAARCPSLLSSAWVAVHWRS